MALKITAEEYNTMQGLYANAGDWVDANTTFRTRFAVESETSNKFTYNNIAGDYSLTLQNGTASDWGFIAGDTVYISFYNYLGLGQQNLTTTVLYTTGSTVFFSDEFIFGGYTYPNNSQFPTENQHGNLLVNATKTPDSVQFDFNLTTSGGTSLGSVLDGEFSRFEIQDVSTFVINTPYFMTALASKSGSLIKDVYIKYLADEGNGWKRYKVYWTFLQWGIIKDGFTEPNYYTNADCLAPIIKLQSFSQYGNPNGIVQDLSNNTQANTGGFDENFNGGVSLFESTGITWNDSLGNVIQGLNYSGISTFVATVNVPSGMTLSYHLGLTWRPVDGAFYQNKALTDVGQNLLINAPEDVFVNTVGYAGPFLGYQDASGARWDFSGLQFDTVGTVLTIQGTVTPNAEANVLFSGIADGGRLSTLWLSIGDIFLTDTPTNNRVSLQLFNADNIDAPVLGVQIPNVVSEKLFDHANNLITTPLPQTTTEDDVLYVSDFKLIDGLNYEGIRTRIFAYNTVTEEEFTLEDNFFSFANVPYILGRFQPNFITPRGFNLPPTSDRNIISLTRKTSLDEVSKYGISLEYGYLSRWQYWLSQANTDNDFFDITQYAFDGKNKNWQRFSNSGNWIVRLAYYTRLNGVDDFNYQEVGIRPYNDDANVSTQWAIKLLSDNSAPTNFIANEMHELSATLTWLTGAYTNPWAEVTIEDFEAGNRWVISSVLAQGGISNNPLQPISGQTKLDLQLPLPNVAELKTLVDMNVVGANKVCVSARIYSEDVPLPIVWEWLLGAEKDATHAYSDARKLRDAYTGDCMSVRRSSDNVQMDIGFVVINNEHVLDEASLLAFTGTSVGDHGFITTRFNQQNNTNSEDAKQVAMSSQPPIVIDGVVLKNPESVNRPAHLCDGVSHFHTIENSFLNSAPARFFLHVFEGVTYNEENRIGFGKSGVVTPKSMRWVIDSSTQNVLKSEESISVLDHFIDVTIAGGQIVTVFGDSNTPTIMRCRLNGVEGTPATISNIITSVIHTEIDLADSDLHKGYKSEDVAYERNRIEDETWIENNANTFYKLY